MNYETETIDRLFLELSQFTQAKTRQQLDLEARDKRRSQLLADIFNHDAILPADLTQRISDELMGITKP